MKHISEFELTNEALERPSDISTESQQFNLYILLCCSHRIKQNDIISFVTNIHENTIQLASSFNLTPQSVDQCNAINNPQHVSTKSEILFLNKL